jgi:hypothetical protein
MPCLTLSCHVMASAPTFMVVMPVVLSQRAEVPDGDGWMPRSLSGWPGDVAHLVQS